jgi:glutathione peroxidase
MIPIRKKGLTMSVHDFTVKDARGNDVPLSTFKGKVLLLVNVASKCGFTPQYKGLQELYEAWHEKGLVILGFPCNQFGHQEPGSDAEIQQFCSLNYGVSFPVMAKIDVNGKDAHPLYKYLTSLKGKDLGGAIKWNFTKFLVDKEGNVVTRFASQVKPEELPAEIGKLLGG